jgi:hypothetical protein
MRKSKILEHALLNDSLLYGNTRGDYHQLNSLTVLLCLEVMMYVPQDHQRIFFCLDIHRLTYALEQRHWFSRLQR